jgi:hypothetical protein
MIGKRNIGRIYGASLATIYATLVTGIIYPFWSGFHSFAAILLIFSALWIGFYAAGFWAAVDRPAEFRRKIPTSAKELRRTKKEFFERLQSQGRK